MVYTFEEKMSAQKLKILIVEDDLLFAIETESQLKSMGYEVLGTADNSGSALEFIYSDTPDAILMDIDIKGKLSGTQIGEQIKHLNIPILYLTSFDDDTHFAEAQKSNIVGYLVKPVRPYNLKTALALALEKTLKKEPEQKSDSFVYSEFFFLKKKEVYQKVPVDSISYIQAGGNYSEIFSKNGEKFIIRSTLNNLEKELSKNSFIRTHRKYIVGIDQIRSIDFTTNKLHLSDQLQIPFSRGKREELESKLKFFS